MPQRGEFVRCNPPSAAFRSRAEHHRDARSVTRFSLALFPRCRQDRVVSKPCRLLVGFVLVVACSSAEQRSDRAAQSNGGSSGTGGGTGGAQSRCPPGTGAWASQSEDPFTIGRAQYYRCEALCQAARDASCAGHDYDVCVEYCNALQNNSVNGRCTEAVGANIECFETLNEPCYTPQRSVASSCESQREDLRCCFERYCADPVNAGRCP
jgi:hypothetical protein